MQMVCEEGGKICPIMWCSGKETWLCLREEFKNKDCSWDVLSSLTSENLQTHKFHSVSGANWLISMEVCGAAVLPVLILSIAPEAASEKCLTNSYSFSMPGRGQHFQIVTCLCLNKASLRTVLL